MPRNALAALVCGTLPGLVAAQSTVEPIFVTATRTAQPANRTLDQTLTITRADIEAAGPLSLAELLQSHANAELRATGGAGQPAGVFLRGANTNHTLVLVDGLRVNSATGGATALENLPLDLIERIEVVKGPFSGLYGSDAIGGVVQIFTRRDARPLLHAALGAGNQSQLAASGGMSVQEGSTSFTVNAGHRAAKPDSATHPGAGFVFNPDRDAYRNAFFNAQVAQTFRNGETLTLSLFQSRGRTRFDAGSDGDDLNRQTLSGYQLESRNEIAPGWKSQLSFGRGSDDLHIEGNYPAAFKTTQDQLAWLNEFQTSRGFMTAGLDVRTEKVTGTTAYDVGKRETRSLFAGYLERLDANQLEFTLRRDEEDQFGARNTGTLSYGYHLSPALVMYAKGGRAFRAPSFNDLYYPSDPLYGPASNPALLPEKSSSGELGLRHQAKNLTFSAIAYDQKIDDLISFVFGTGPQNIRKARIRGIELEAGTPLFGAEVRASLTRQRPRDEDTGTLLRGRAETFGRITVSKAWASWQVQTTLVGSGPRFDSTDAAPGSRMGGYGIVNANIRHTLDKRWTVELAVTNLGDKRYELAQGYNVPGRQVFVNILYRAR